MSLGGVEYQAENYYSLILRSDWLLVASNFPSSAAAVLLNGLLPPSQQTVLATFAPTTVRHFLSIWTFEQFSDSLKAA